MNTHRLKTIQPYFDSCWNQTKTFEVRKNDRNFSVGDVVYLQEYNSETNSYSGREIKGKIKYILDQYPAIQENHVVFSFSIDEYIGGFFDKQDNK